MSTAKLTDDQRRKLIPISRKFVELVTNLEKGDKKRLNRFLRDFQKSKFPSFSPPFLDTAKCVLEWRLGNHEKSNSIAREIIDSHTTYEVILNVLFTYLKRANDKKYLEKIYLRFIEANDQETDHLVNAINFYLSIANYSKAQELSMKYMAKTKSDPEKHKVGIAFAAVNSYFKAKYENNPIFYKFAYNFIDKLDEFKDIISQDLAHIKIQSLLAENSQNTDNFNKALQFVNSAAVKELFENDGLIKYLRLQIQIYEALGNDDEIGKLAERAIREINNDLLEEWKLIVKHHSNAQALISEFTEKGPIALRGPRIAQIELDIKEGKDILPSLLNYISTYKNKLSLFGDIKIYLTDEVVQKLKERINDIEDCLLKCYVSDQVQEVTVNEELKTIVLTQDLLRKYDGNDNSILINSAKYLAPLSKHEKSRIHLLRVSGLLGLSVLQNKLWVEQRLDAINFLSLMPLYLCDAIKAWDIKTIQKMTDDTLSFCNKGLEHSTQNIDVALQNFNFLAVEMASRFLSSIDKNISFYAAKILHDIPSILSDNNPVEALTPIKFDKYLNKNDIDNLEIRTDKSILTLYFRDSNLDTIIYPSIKQTIMELSAAIQLLFSLKLPNLKPDQYIEQLESLSNESQWNTFVKFVKGGCKSLNSSEMPSNPDIFFYTTLALSAKVSNSPKEVINVISSSLTESKNKLFERLDTLQNDENIKNILNTLESNSEKKVEYTKVIEEQKNNIEEATSLVMKLLQ